MQSRPAVRAVFATPRGGSEDRVMCGPCAENLGAIVAKRCPPLVLDCPVCGAQLFWSVTVIWRSPRC